MSSERRLTVEPWAVEEPQLDVDRLAHTESVFALSNGHIGLRGNLDEGEPHGLPGSYLNGFFESLPLPYAELAYGNPEQGQSVIDVTNGKLIRLLVDDEPFDVRLGRLQLHRRRLDLRSGVLEREALWTSPAGQTVRVCSSRLVSFAQRAVAAFRYTVTPIDEPARIVVQSVLVANEPVPITRVDPRAAAILRAPLASRFHHHDGTRVALGHQTVASGLQVAAALDHLVDGPPGYQLSADSQPDLARVTVGARLAAGETLTLTKYLTYGWSSRRSMPALRDQVDAALAAARLSGWEGLIASQRAYLDDVWDRSDITVEGDDEVQQAVRFAMFQLVQGAARAEQRAIPAKGLTGRGYDGHTFWDMETYTLPMLSYTLPHASRDALLWRHSTLPQASQRATQLGLDGATFPWRTIRGEECSGYWPASTAAFHVNAAVADAVRRYVNATEDEVFHAGAGLELAVQTARLWCSLGHHDAQGHFRLDGVTGPDEYTALVDNNTFTNLMAARNLTFAADSAERFPSQAAMIHVTGEEVEAWRDAAGAMAVPFDSELGVTQQSEGFTRYRPWNFDETPPSARPLLLHYPYYMLYSSQVIKQADLVLALYLCGDHFCPAQKRSDFDFYDPLTVNDSSLSASIQGIVAAEVGHLDRAYAYLRQTALVDLCDETGTTDDGLHLAALGGTWLMVVAGLGGMRDHGKTLSFAPRLVPPLRRVAFRLVYRGRRLHVDFDARETGYRLVAGEPLTISHKGEALTVTRDTWTRVPAE